LQFYINTRAPSVTPHAYGARSVVHVAC